MHPQRVRRDALHQLTDLPNIGPSMADSLRLLDMHTPEDLCGRDPIALYLELCRRTASRQAPCVLDTLIAVTRFMAGDDPAPWWHYTAERKAWESQGLVDYPTPTASGPAVEC